MEQVFIDTSGFKALIDNRDKHHKIAEKIWYKLRDNPSTILATSNFILDESYTLLRIRCGLYFALKLRQLLDENATVFKIIRVTVTDEQYAWNWFKREWKDLSYTDCVSFALMKRVGIQRVVAFDEHFSRAGFAVEK